MVLPYKGPFRITTLFGKPGPWACGWHIGLDMVGQGDKTVLSIGPGVVEKVGASGRYGNHVRVSQDNGLVVLYAHLSAVKVYSGQIVTAKHPIGTEGSTGNSTGSHLHLEIHKGCYKYPDKGTSPASCPWLLDPCQVLGIKKALGEAVRLEEFKTGKAVLAHWAKIGLIDSPDYWEKALDIVKNLDKLLIKAANHYEG